MSQRLEMTPERAMIAVEMMREAIRKFDEAGMPHDALYFVVHTAVWPVAPTEADAQEAERRLSQLPEFQID